MIEYQIFRNHENFFHYHSCVGIYRKSGYLPCLLNQCWNFQICSQIFLCKKRSDYNQCWFWYEKRFWIFCHWSLRELTKASFNTSACCKVVQRIQEWRLSCMNNLFGMKYKKWNKHYTDINNTIASEVK